MSPIERKPLPPPNSRATPLADTDRADIMARANEVLDHYLNGPGSYFDGGTRKPLVSEFGNSTTADLERFKDSIIASKQFVDDPNSILDSVVDLISKAIIHVEQIARDNEGRDGISRRPPDTNDPIDDPRVISPRALGNRTLPISLSTEGEKLTSAPGVREIPSIFSTKPIRYLRRTDGSTPPASVSDTGAPVARFVLPDQLNNASGGRTDWAAALAGLAAPPQRRGAFVSGNDALSRAAGGDSSSSRPGQAQGPMAPTLLEYIRHLNQLSANTPRAPILERAAPGASLAPSDSPVPMGLPGRLAALAGIDPDNPDQLAPPPGGLLARLRAIGR